MCNWVKKTCFKKSTWQCTAPSPCPPPRPRTGISSSSASSPCGNPWLRQCVRQFEKSLSQKNCRCKCIWIYTCLSVCMYVSMCICVCTCVCLYVHMCVHVCMHVHVNMYACACKFPVDQLGLSQSTSCVFPSRPASCSSHMWLVHIKRVIGL